jgi:NhaP-type Na+/H+ or K+/H+ antiporter
VLVGIRNRAAIDMNGESKLTLIKSIHTLIWLFFNGVIFYMLYAAISNKLDIWLWIGYGFVFLEGLILLAFKSHCPLNLLARQYTNSTKDNFDIYLPSWLAKYTKLIYTTIFAVISIITLYQILN